MTVQNVVSLIALGALLVGCEASDQLAAPSPDASAPSPVASPTEHRAEAVCERDITFETTYLPEGFRIRVFDGRAHGSRRPDRDGQVIYTCSGRVRAP